MRRKVFWQIGLTSAMVWSGCKNYAGNSVSKSLDGLAGASMSNVCSGPFPVIDVEGFLDLSEVPIPARGGLAKAVRQALTAVPPGLTDLYFRSARGSLKVVNDIATACAGIRPEWRIVENGVTQSCLSRSPGRPQFLVAATAEGVAHNTLRSLAFALADFPNQLAEIRRGLDPNDHERAAAYSSLIHSMKVSLLYGYQADLGAPPNDLAAGMLGHVGDPASRIFAETLDSAYCSSASRRIFQERFPKTRRAFDATTKAVVEVTGPSGAKTLVAWTDLADSTVEAGAFALQGDGEEYDQDGANNVANYPVWSDESDYSPAIDMEAQIEPVDAADGRSDPACAEDGLFLDDMTCTYGGRSRNFQVSRNIIQKIFGGAPTTYSGLQGVEFTDDKGQTYYANIVSGASQEYLIPHNPRTMYAGSKIAQRMADAWSKASGRPAGVSDPADESSHQFVPVGRAGGEQPIPKQK